MFKRDATFKTDINDHRDMYKNHTTYCYRSVLPMTTVTSFLLSRAGENGRD